jgi:hypothetical protein
MPPATTGSRNSFSRQYFMITRSEPQYDLIKNQLLDQSTACPLGSSYYFIRSDGENGCICRLKPANGAAIFYEILDHRNEGISDDEIREAASSPSRETPLAGYYYLTPAMEKKILNFRTSVRISLTE